MDLNQWLTDLTGLLTELAQRDDDIGRKAEGLGQSLPELRASLRAIAKALLPPMPEYSTEAEGDAYAHGWFDGNEAEPYGVTVPDGKDKKE